MKENYSNVTNKDNNNNNKNASDWKAYMCQWLR